MGICPTFGYIRTSRYQEPGHPGSDTEVRYQLNAAGVESEWAYADVAVSGTTSGISRVQWQLLDRQIVQGDVLIVVAFDRLLRRYPATM